MKLTSKTLHDLPTPMARPGYDRGLLKPGIVHIGCGNFHRAHQAVYLDDLFALGEGQDFALLGAGVRAGDAAMAATLAAQDWLYSVTELEPGAHRTRIIGAMTGFVPVQADNAALIRAMAQPGIRIVSLTVTEGGYYIDPMTGTFSPDHPDIQHDAHHPTTPQTAFGAIIAALKLRRAAGHIPFTVMCCDNIPHNGRVTRDAVMGLAGLCDPALADWIGQAVAFPNSMVDRITPATGNRERDLIRRTGLEDDAPVTCEPFRQWVMEDHFPGGRPPLEKVGVTFTDRVDLFESMKIRILNGGHAIIAYPAGLLGIGLVHEAMAHPLIRAFLDRVLSDEVLPTVAPVPGQNLSDYKTLILERFSNPDVADTVRRLCLDGSNRQPKFILPTLGDALSAQGPLDGLVLSSALWCRYCFGTDEAGAPIADNDPNWHSLTARARAARQAPLHWLDMAEVYGDLGHNKLFADKFSAALRGVWDLGTNAMLTRYLAG